MPDLLYLSFLEATKDYVVASFSEAIYPTFANLQDCKIASSPKGSSQKREKAAHLCILSSCPLAFLSSCPLRYPLVGTLPQDLSSSQKPRRSHFGTKYFFSHGSCFTSSSHIILTMILISYCALVQSLMLAR